MKLYYDFLGEVFTKHLCSTALTFITKLAFPISSKREWEFEHLGLTSQDLHYNNYRRSAV